eukprot:1194332-Prorocentrum_minimum.AAC.2
MRRGSVGYFAEGLMNCFAHLPLQPHPSRAGPEQHRGHKLPDSRPHETRHLPLGRVAANQRLHCGAATEPVSVPVPVPVAVSLSVSVPVSLSVCFTIDGAGSGLAARLTTWRLPCGATWRLPCGGFRRLPTGGRQRAVDPEEGVHAGAARALQHAPQRPHQMPPARGDTLRLPLDHPRAALARRRLSSHVGGGEPRTTDSWRLGSRAKHLLDSVANIPSKMNPKR